MFKRIVSAAAMSAAAAVSLLAAPASAHQTQFVPVAAPLSAPAWDPTDGGPPTPPPMPSAADQPQKGFHAPKGNPGRKPDGTGSQKVSAAGPTALATIYRTYVGVRKTLSSPAVDNGCSFFGTVHSPFVSTADEHSITECSAHFNGNIIEIGWRKDKSGTLQLFTYAWKRDPVTGDPTQLCYNGCGYVDYAAETTAWAGMDLTSAVGTSKNFYAQHFNSVWWVAYDSKWIGYWPDTVFGTQTPAFDRTDFIQVFDELAGRQYTGSGSGSTDICSDMGSNKLPSQTGAQELTKVHVVGGSTANDTWTTFTQADGGVSVNTSHYNVAAFTNTADSSLPRNFKSGGAGSC